ncbi:MAG: Rrf2 family transcriptional regulator [Ruminococcus sp.]|nr:Rrf2 family transcriptional regulator [Ruminococcus sp.]
MRISTKGRYSISVLLYLAQHRDEGNITLREISEKLDISKKYLEQIVSILNRGRLLSTNRGAQGGYRLAVNPARCSVGDVLRLTENTLCQFQDSDSSYYSDDPTEYVWDGLSGVINEYLDSITLQDILDSITQSYVNNYVI